MEQTDHLLAEARRYGYIEGDQVWLRPFMDLPARQVGQVKESEEASLRYFAQRFEVFRGKVEELLTKIEESENKGSFLMKALHLKEQIAAYDGLGDFESLHRRLTEAEESIKVTIARNREKNLATKISLIQEVEALQHTIDWQTATEQLKELRQTWIKTGPVDKQLTEELETRLRVAIDHFMVKKKDFFADKKAMANRVLDKYMDLIRQSESLQNSEDFEGTTKKLKQLQQDWKEVGGSLPRKQANDLWTRFRAAHNHFFERLKEHISTKRVESSRDTQMEDNLSRKRALVAEAEALLNRPMSEAVAKAKELQMAWKKVGPVRGEESDRVWEQFLLACDKIFELSSLEHFIRKRQPTGSEPGTPEDQVNVRVQALRDFIKYDRQEQEALEDNLGKLSSSPGNDAFRTMLQGKIRAFERKIRTKNELIEMLRKRLVA
ncbi:MULTISPECIES: DUF349 domain-containing protein [Hymenobacter]|uniref:DUF349 domain-containing protein n=1 Tax=Hymenobacter jejuensis TaxID=2502781 RepID=A0A5B8A195_9BACT|nr:MULTISPECIES: DUF349 domain-containing protein [Hymenobacter]MBC6991586.1 DUF349 domain-containing protein [Hymenobacter sp. BT491]QDA59912.1 DUF349 domain-containing protein [Hymenobacter jejuensis]